MHYPNLSREKTILTSTGGGTKMVFIRNVNSRVRLVRYLVNGTGNIISARGIGNCFNFRNISITADLPADHDHFTDIPL
jgi:hypothetical protein